MYIIDRFEADWAVIEYNRKTFNFPLALVPSEAMEGDILLIEVSVDAKATAKLRSTVKKLAGTVFKDEQ
ncbi:MAG: hypothetical protein A4E55_00914 [Pelotomaculum sp. PtaU1.Bin035]|nr:MAG: hypothetical protein A4E55_00914 [Pelotomaculum sp. PtaU1.Bin035]